MGKADRAHFFDVSCSMKKTFKIRAFLEQNRCEGAYYCSEVPNKRTFHLNKTPSLSQTRSINV